ncbi:Baseplate assembly protein J-like, predicted [Moorella glycerini]|uniref:Baseplate J-like protein n=1 Tax=Neomoorella stamsii TaxID=1266720 RepID=A0A9X7J0C4_9FIRM|nr:MULTISPECIES: baseplate J/gp47 family protein [Moorella]PRR69581.1 Baseplate J-like protein [Moorella stamsii]CEP67895.1 Baseplate assembly protein J-like, predicted [Moorella glycerini]CEP68765.1 Baseplate assembly protein J-like, predicted [Moorella glycerini]
MADLPEYLTDQTYETILQRMLDTLPSDLDKSEGSFIWDALSPAAIELALAAIWAQQVLERGFASTTFGQYLDLRCEEHGITRRPATYSTAPVVLTGEPGTILPAGHPVGTQSSEAAPAVGFVTESDIEIGPDGTGAGTARAQEPGSQGNVAAHTITMLYETYPGITGIDNPEPATGGLDEEDDASLLARYLQRVRSPSAGGNKADYVNWAMEVPGVGGVSVIPVRDGPGTVSIAIINTNKEPADQALVDEVQNYIAPPWANEAEAENMSLGGYGVSVDTTLTDDTGDSVKMVYDATGAGTITHSSLQALLQQPGIWQARVRVKVDDNTGTADLLQIGIWNVSAAAWAKTRPSGTVDAVVTLKASDLATSFGNKTVEFYWNGQDQIELRITRLTTDTTTTVWVDRGIYRSAFSKDTGEGKAPVGARVTVEPATAVLINVSATLTIAAGYNADSVKSAVRDNIAAYIKSLAFTSDNDVRYVRIGQAILDTPGVTDYQNLLVNGGTANVTVGDQEVAVVGSVNLT